MIVYPIYILYTVKQKSFITKNKINKTAIRVSPRLDSEGETCVQLTSVFIVRRCRECGVFLTDALLQ